MDDLLIFDSFNGFYKINNSEIQSGTGSCSNHLLTQLGYVIGSWSNAFQTSDQSGS